MSSSKTLQESDNDHSERMSAEGKAPRRKIRYLFDDPTNPRLPFQEQDALSEATSATTIADEDMSAEVLVRPHESSAGHIVFSGAQNASIVSAKGSAATTNRLLAAPSLTAPQSGYRADVQEELIPEFGLPFKRIVRSETSGARLRYLLESTSSSSRTCGWVEAGSLRNDHKVIAEFHIEDGHAEGREWAIFALWGTKWGHILAFVGAQGL